MEPLWKTKLAKASVLRTMVVFEVTGELSSNEYCIGLVRKMAYTVVSLEVYL